MFTGCNDVLTFFDTYGNSTTADSAILMSVTSGRKNLLRTFTKPDLAASIAIASEQSEAGFGAYPFPVETINGSKILQVCKGMHADVWLDIMGPGGIAEKFSSDSSDEELGELFRDVRLLPKNLSILTVGDDETIPSTVDKDLLLQRFVRAAAGQSSVVRGRVIKEAHHAMEQEEAQDLVVGEDVAFLSPTQKVV